METFGFIQNIGVGQLLIILVIVLLLFGSRKLPDLARSLGSSMKELRKGMSDSDDKKTESRAASEKSQIS